MPMNNELFATPAPAQPLAAELRPARAEDFVGQRHLLAPGKPLRRCLDAQPLHSMILWGPPGVGKTTLARLLCAAAHSRMLSLSAVMDGVKAIREAVAAGRAERAAGRQCVLFVDEVHRFNKAQQDAFLPFVEDGTLTLIGATTENPAFELNSALLSRARVYRLRPLGEAELQTILRRGADALGLALSEAQTRRLALAADGDARRALNLIELAHGLADAGAPDPTQEPANGPPHQHEPAPGPTQKPAPDPAHNHEPDPTQKPAPDPTQKPAPDPTQKPAPGPTQKPANGPAHNHAPDSAHERTQSPPHQPAPSSTQKPPPDSPHGRAHLSDAALNELLQGRARRFDKGGDEFYDQISALHKAVRGSSPDGALYWYARMLDGGCDPLYVARRVIRMASEDIGNADPRALSLSLDAWQTLERLGSPEGELALAQAIVYLACVPKSNAVYTAYRAARRAVEEGGSEPVPAHLRNAPTALAKAQGHGAGYRYAHDEPGAFAAGERYLPSSLAERRFYQPTERGLEGKIRARLEDLRRLDRESAVQRDPDPQ